ncbi:outer membrane protein [Croceicoccus bisphenolivorans]|uniref:outer membrane protein n=1 Tax=Croceicoccus bisphenolivorans TaxID=1783232 RepID=UPI000830296B|nr:outer membrane beta-barrel protein [Croceicoccus bisphenolivorans]
MRTIILSGSIIVSAIATPALAQEADASGFYIGALAGYDSVELEYDGLSGDESDVLYGVVAGYDANLGGAVVGIEAEIADSGVSSTATDIFELDDSATLSASRDLYIGARVGARVTDSILLYAKGGYTNARAKLSYTDSFGDTYSDSDTLDGYRIGAGAEYTFGNFGFRAEYRYSDYGEYSYEGVSTGIEARRSQVVGTIVYGF